MQRFHFYDALAVAHQSPHPGMRNNGCLESEPDSLLNLNVTSCLMEQWGRTKLKWTDDYNMSLALVRSVSIDTYQCDQANSDLLLCNANDITRASLLRIMQNVGGGEA